jgi:DNA-binding protein WhiA
LVEELSFSLSVKDELAHVQPSQECCQRMELAAIVRANGRISIGGSQRLACTLNTDHAPLARKVIRLLKACFSLQTEVLVMRRQRLRKNLSYMVRILPQQGVEAMMKAIGIMDDEGQLQDWVELPELEHDHCRRAYLRGTFLGTGWVSAPDRQHHLEFTTVNTEAADALGQMLFRYGIPVRMAYRKESMLLYLKDAAHITQFLNVVGAHQALLHYEDVRALKGVKNRVNRQVNAETANLSKTVEASARQVEAIELLRADGRLNRTAKSVQELAMLRVNHPDASLKELGEMCNPPVGKSGVNHRMRLIMQMAER